MDRLTKLTPKVADTTRVALQLSALLAEADEAQWRRSVILAPDDDDMSASSIHASGQHSDPTFDAVADQFRMELRDAVLAAEQALRAHQADMAGAADRLRRALDRWNGGL